MNRFSAFSAFAFLAALGGCDAKTYRAVALANPGFEEPAAKTGIAKWTTGQHAGKPSYEMVLDTQDKTEGAASFRIKRTLPQIFGTIYQIVPIPDAAGKTIRLRLKAKSADVSRGEWQFMLTFLGNNNEVIDGGPAETLSGTHGWHEVTVKAVVPKFATRVQVGGSLTGDGTVWLDDVRLDLAD